MRLRDAGSRQMAAPCGQLWSLIYGCGSRQRDAQETGLTVPCAVRLRDVRPRRSASRTGGWQSAIRCVAKVGWLAAPRKRRVAESSAQCSRDVRPRRTGARAGGPVANKSTS